MMTIKVCARGDDGFIEKTYLHEVINPSYRVVEYKDFNDWCRIYNDEVLNDRRLGYTDMEEILETDKSGRVHIINFIVNSDTGQRGVIFTRNSTVYIMHEGKTVDTIYVGV